MPGRQRLPRAHPPLRRAHPDDLPRVRLLDRRRRLRARACRDYIVMVKGGAKVFLGGPPLVKMAIDEDADEETLGGAEMHSRVSGVSDYLAADELDAIRHRPRDRRAPQLAQARALEARARSRSRATIPTSCSASRRSTCASRSTCARSSRASSTARASTSSSRSTARTLVTGWAHVHGYPVGILANNGILFSESSREGRAVHPALQPDRHAAPVPAEHHRLHGRHAATSRAASSRTAPS